MHWSETIAPAPPDDGSTLSKTCVCFLHPNPQSCVNGQGFRSNYRIGSGYVDMWVPFSLTSEQLKELDVNPGKSWLP